MIITVVISSSSSSSSSSANMRIRRNPVRGYLTKTELARPAITGNDDVSSAAPMLMMIDRRRRRTSVNTRSVSKWPAVMVALLFVLGFSLSCVNVSALVAEDETTSDAFTAISTDVDHTTSTKHIKVACVQRCSDQVSPHKSRLKYIYIWKK